MPLVDELPPRLRAPLRQAATLAATSLWIAPAVSAVVALTLAMLLLVWNPSMTWLPGRLDDPIAARAGLSAVVTATVAAVSLVGTGTIVALQLATGQYSPRLLRDVLTDGTIRWSLGGLVGVVVYSLVVLTQTVEGRPSEAAVALGLLGGVAAVGLLVLFVSEVTNRIRLETIIEDVTAAALASVESTYPRDAEAVDVEVPDHATTLHAPRSGYVQSVELEALAKAAASHGVHLRIRLPVGEYLVRDTAVAWAWAADDGGGEEVGEGTHDDLVDAVDRALALGVDRTLSGDPAYGLRHLVDIGLRGVSPSVNDPTTTVQCIHNATRVLIRLAQRPLHDGQATRDGCRAVLPRPDLGDHLGLAQSQLLQYGGHDPRVVEALAQQLRDLAEATPADPALLRTHLQRLRADAEGRDHRPHDRELVESAFARVDEALEGTADDEDPSTG